MAASRPDRITAIISQNGNAYEEGLSQGWNPIQAYWREPTEARRAALRDFLAPEATRWQYTHGVADEAQVAPESYTLDSALLARPGNAEIQLATYLSEAGQSTQAIELLQAAANAEPTLDALNALGIAYARSGRHAGIGFITPDDAPGGLQRVGQQGLELHIAHRRRPAVDEKAWRAPAAR